MPTLFPHIVLGCRDTLDDMSGGNLEGGKQMKVRNVIRGGVAVAASGILSGIGSAYTLASARTPGPAQVQEAHSTPTRIPPGYFRPNRNTVEVLSSASLSSKGLTPTPMWFGNGISVRKGYSSQLCGINSIGFTSSPGPATLDLYIQRGVAATFSANVGLSAGVVTAGVGFSVTSSFGVTARDDIYVPAGQLGSITAYPLFEDVNFQVWQNQWVGPEHQIGSGYALKPIGVCFEPNP